jgi:hypothetical protein
VGPILDHLKQVRAGMLDVGYVEVGPGHGQAVLLLHGWPYDIHSLEEVAPALADAGYRVVVPYLRGYGTTRFLSDDTNRNGQQAVLAVDAIALMKALGMTSAIIGGFNWAPAPRTSSPRCGRSGAGPWSRSADISSEARTRTGRHCRRRRSFSGGTSTTSPPHADAPDTTPTAASSRSSSGSPRHRTGTSTTPPSSAARRRSTTPTT